MASRRQWRPQLTKSEQWQGWAFFALYLLVFPILLPQLLRVIDDRFELYASTAVSNMAYYIIIAVALFAVFWAFLLHGLHLLLDWLPENLFAFGVGLAGAVGLTFLAGLIPLPVENPVFADYPQEYLISSGATVAIVVFLRPIVEEILFRGLLFGGLRTISRTAAYCVTVPLFALCAVWQHAAASGNPAYLLLAVQYLPLGLALTWCYDNGGSIWSPIFMRIAFSAIALTYMLNGGGL